MKEFSIAVAARNPRMLARVALISVASILVAMLVLMAISSGPGGGVVLAQETESPSPTATGPAIQLLNPEPSYDPLADPACQPPACEPGDDPPEISDRYDGSDRAFHVVAWTRQAPAGAVVEAYWQTDGDNEITVGILNQVDGSPSTWEMFWDIPSDLDEGNGDFKVRLFQNTATGFEQIAEDVVPAHLQHEGEYDDPDDAPAEETVEITWPGQNGEIGFYKGRGGAWRTVIDGVASGSQPFCSPTLPGDTQECDVAGGTQRVYLFVTTAAPGNEPDYQQCGFSNTSANNVRAPDDRAITWSIGCTLPGEIVPSEVTAIAAVASEVDNASQTGFFTQDSADAHRVRGYAQDPRDMNLEVVGVGGGTAANYPTSHRRTADSDCLRLEARVTDHLDRPVQGANLDVDLQGPNDQAAFGDDETSGANSDDSASKNPDKGDHATEGKRFCVDGVTANLLQGEHNVVGPPGDIKHEESVAGSGLDGGGAGPGRWRFLVYSDTPGFADITVWIDDLRLQDETANREADNDERGDNEVSATARVQWLPNNASVTIQPKADAAAPGTCNRYVVQARAGSAVMPNVNVDVHAQGPNNDLDFCDPGEGTPRKAPDQGDHEAEDDGEATHAGAEPEDPRIQHTEGQTNADGNFIIGISSPVNGQTDLTAWIDGEESTNNDVMAGGEPSNTASKSWASSPEDAEVRFVNPSGYGGGGDSISNKADADGNFHLVARVDLPEIVPGVEFEISSDGEAFTNLGAATRVAGTDTWELFWNVGVEDDSYTLRAKIAGTNKVEDRDVTVDNTMETAEITSPLNGGTAPFQQNILNVRGTASEAAEDVDIFYTTTDARQPRESADWIECGSVELPGGDGSQNFQGDCELQDSNDDGTPDAAFDVTGIAVLTFTCDPIVGCSPALGPIQNSGDAHRVFGQEGNPSVTIEPAEAAGQIESCKAFELTVTDGVGRAMENVNVDVHLTGPNDGAEFCNPRGASTRRAPEQGSHSGSGPGDQSSHEGNPDTHHTEGETDAGGGFFFGVRSGSVGDSQIQGWADQNDNDELDAGERSDTSLMHWNKRGGGGGGGRGCTIRGTSGRDRLVGTAGDDVICAGAGRDRIRGRGGNDTIFGGRGSDLIRGNRGNDTINGGRGSDIIRGGAGSDVMRGNGQDDVIRGYTGRDRLIGGGGNDTLRAGRGRDRLRGNAGNDLLDGGPGRDRCRGGRGRDRLIRC